MSHTVKIEMIADQEITIRGVIVNIHDITGIIVDYNRKITDAYIENDWSSGWLSMSDKKRS